MGASAAQVLERRDWDVLVVGAGPAGLTAARTLASQHVSVLVVEEHDTIGDPVHCTGVLGLEAFDEFDLPRDTICTAVHAARFHGRNGQSVLVDGGDVSAAVVDRGRFDRALAEAAIDAGATIARGVRVQRIAVSDRLITASVDSLIDRSLIDRSCDSVDSTRIHARACVLACGAQYRFNRQLGLGIPRAYLQTAQIETAFPAVDAVEIDLGRSLAPAGFAWLVPFRRDDTHMARVGIMANDSAGRRFRQYADVLAERHRDVAISARPRVKVLPLAPVKRTYTDRVVAVGDAAGLAKPTTGGGIYYSLLSGQLAGEVLTDAIRKDALGAATLRAYESQWEARLGPELRAGLAFRTLAARFDDRAIDALIELASVDGIIPLLRRTANFNWHRSAALALLRNPGFRKIVLGALWS